MEADLKKRFAPELTEEKAGNYSPLVLAFTGDSVFETAVRTLLVLRGQRPVNVLNRLKNQYVKAHAQALMAELKQRLPDVAFAPPPKSEPTEARA